VRVLDLFVGALIAFPWLTEWFSYETAGGTFVEASDLGVPMLMAGLVAVVVHERNWYGAGALPRSSLSFLLKLWLPDTQRRCSPPRRGR
jgi:hypothetical protein